MGVWCGSGMPSYSGCAMRWKCRGRKDWTWQVRCRGHGNFLSEIMGKLWENEWKWWENHGKMMGKLLEKVGNMESIPVFAGTLMIYKCTEWGITLCLDQPELRFLIGIASKVSTHPPLRVTAHLFLADSVLEDVSELAFSCLELRHYSWSGKGMCLQIKDLHLHGFCNGRCCKMRLLTSGKLVP